MTYLYGGQVLRVDLTERKITKEPTSTYIDRFMGGKGINAKILFDEIDPQTTPYAPENRLLFSAGPLVGTCFPGACRVDVMAKSPVTGALANSGMGGYFGAALKFAGYDNIVVQGKADKPVYLSVQDDKAKGSQGIYPRRQAQLFPGIHQILGKDRRQQAQPGQRSRLPLNPASYDQQEPCLTSVMSRNELAISHGSRRRRIGSAPVHCGTRGKAPPGRTAALCRIRHDAPAGTRTPRFDRD